jgi:hypothetical protein
MASTTEEGLTIPRYVLLALLASFVIMAIFALIASGNPDGLERMFEAVGVEGLEGGILAIEMGEGLGADLFAMFIGMVTVFAIIIIIMSVVRYLKRR